jgi:hypothetical protein
MTSTTKKLLLRLIEQHRGDDLYRAKAAFRGLSPEQMQEQYGASGQTRQQILDDYQRRDDELLAVKQEVEAL